MTDEGGFIQTSACGVLEGRLASCRERRPKSRIYPCYQERGLQNICFSNELFLIEWLGRIIRPGISPCLHGMSSRVYKTCSDFKSRQDCATVALS